MSKIRINDLARELEVKSKAILDVLPEIGVTEKKPRPLSSRVPDARLPTRSRPKLTFRISRGPAMFCQLSASNKLPRLRLHHPAPQ
jgi:translation initiation factor IF-2